MVSGMDEVTICFSVQDNHFPVFWFFPQEVIIFVVNCTGNMEVLLIKKGKK